MTFFKLALSTKSLCFALVTTCLMLGMAAPQVVAKDNEIEKRLKDFFGSAQERAIIAPALQLTHVAVLLEANRGKRGLRFSVQGQAIESVQVQIISLAGRSVYRSDFVKGTVLRWALSQSEAQRFGNGVYLYVMTAKSSNGQARSYIGKFTILR